MELENKDLFTINISDNCPCSLYRCYISYNKKILKDFGEKRFENMDLEIKKFFNELDEIPKIIKIKSNEKCVCFNLFIPENVEILLFNTYITNFNIPLSLLKLIVNKDTILLDKCDEIQKSNINTIIYNSPNTKKIPKKIKDLYKNNGWLFHNNILTR